MHPILVHLGTFPIYSYGLLLAAAFFLANQFAMYLARRFGYSEDAVEHVVLVSILLGVVGSRLGYVVQYPAEYLRNPLQMLNLREGGLTVVGGILLVMAWHCYRAWRRGASVLDLFDFLAPPLLVGMAVGRLGCFAHGCCFGLETTLPWAVTYPATTIPAGTGGPRHPSQLYEMSLDLVLLAYLVYQLPRLRYAGQNFYAFLLGYGAIRFFDEFTKFNAFYYGGLSVYQWVSAGMMLVGAAGLSGFLGRPPVSHAVFPLTSGPLTEASLPVAACRSAGDT